MVIVLTTNTIVLGIMITMAFCTFGEGILKALEYAVEYYRAGGETAAEIDERVVLTPLRNKSLFSFVASGFFATIAVVIFHFLS